ncbi:PAS domain S-box protein [candidate division WOR-3 bacterium]|nr:PAS domain S-box protein [candidate division WOR-3 bacterium]
MARTKILIVEDEKIVAVDIKNTLLHLGYAVCGIALSGEDALKQIKETQPALVLMDIVLKGDMDGIETAEHVRHRFNTPVIYLTAYADHKTLERAKITEPFGYIIKPFEEKELYTAIEMALYKHKMENKVKESEKKYHRLIDRLTDMVFTLDKDGNFTYLSPQFEKLSGHPVRILLGHSFTEVVAPEYIKSTAKLFKQGFSGKKISLYETELLCKDGKRIPIELNVTSILNAEGNPIGRLGVARDITERKQAEEIVKKHVEMEKTLTKISATVVKAKQMDIAVKKALAHLGTVFDVDQVYLFQIREKEKIWDYSYGWTRKGLKVKKRSRRGVSFDNFSQWIKQLKHHQVITIPDVKKLSSRLQKNIKKISEQNIKSFLIIPLHFEENFFGALGFFNNTEIRTWQQDDIGILQTAGEIITSGLVKDRFQKKLTHVLEELETDRMKMVELAKRIIDAQEKERLYLASEIHDDMLQGLVAILYFLQMIDISTLDKKMQERKEKLIELIKASIDRGRRLISEIEPIREPEIGLIQAVKKSIDLRFAGPGTKVEFNYPGKFPKINFAAKVNILRIIQEALMNVRKHAQATRVSIKISVFKNKLKMEVKDDGVGFNLKLFLKKNTRHYGILTMQERAQLIDGELTVTSRSGKGTIVKGFFPFVSKRRTRF